MRLGEQTISTWWLQLRRGVFIYLDDSMNDHLHNWPLKGGSQSPALASRAALLLFFLTQLLLARVGTHAPQTTFSPNSSSANDTLGRIYATKLSVSSEAPSSAARDFDGQHLLSPFDTCVHPFALPESSFWILRLLYRQLSLCKWELLSYISPSSSCSSVSQSAIRVREGSSDIARSRILDRPNSILSAFFGTISAAFPSLVYASATRVRLGIGHTHRMNHGAGGGALQPGDSNPASDEESEEEEDTILTEEDQAEEDECAAQIVIQEMLEGDFSGDSDSLMVTSHQWLKLKDALLQRMTKKDVCTASRSSEQVCIVPSDEGSTSGQASAGGLPCGGAKYEHLIEQFLDERNCVTAMAMSHTLSQGWLGLPHADESGTGGAEISITSGPIRDKAEHSVALAARGGLLGILIRQYEQVIDSNVLDSQLSSVYSAAAELLKEFKFAAVDGLNAFNSLELRDALQVRRAQQIAILCSLGEGKKADLGSSVLSSDTNLIVRVNSDGHDQATVKAFIDAVSAFSKFVKALLEDGGYADRAIDIHKDFYAFRFQKMQVLMQEVEPSTVIHTSNTLLNALPLEKHKKHKPKHKTHGQAGEDGADGKGDSSSSSGDSKESTSFPQLSATASEAALPGKFLQLVAEQRDAFRQQVESFYGSENVPRHSRNPNVSFLQTSQLLAAPIPYNTDPPQQPSQSPNSPPLAPPMLVAAPTAAAGGVPQGPALPVQQLVPVNVSIPAQPSGMQQPGGSPPQTGSVSIPGSVPAQWAAQPLSPQLYGVSPFPPQQQQLQQEPRQLPLQGTPQQIPLATQQPQQPPQQQQPPPPQQQQQPQQQPQPMLAQPFEQTFGGYTQHDQQQGQVTSPSSSPQQQMQYSPGIQQVGYAAGAAHNSQEDQARQQGETQHSQGEAAGAVGHGEGSEGHKEVKAGHGHGGEEPGHGDAASRAFSEKGVPVKQKMKAIMSRLRMFKMEKTEVLFEPDEPAIDRIVRAGYLETSDRVFIAWGSLLPQAAVTTVAELITMLLPIPEVDLALFYNKTLHENGQVTDGYDGPLPINDKVIIERFSRYVDETYRDCWRLFFAKNDHLIDDASPPHPQQQQQSWNANTSSTTGMSALQLGTGINGHLSLAAEVEQLVRHSGSSQLTRELQQHNKIATEADDTTASAASLLKAPSIKLHEAALAQVHEHMSSQEIGLHGQHGPRKLHKTVTFVESSDGISVSEVMPKFVNELYVERKTVQAMSGAASRTHIKLLSTAAFAAMAPLFSFFFVNF